MSCKWSLEDCINLDIKCHLCTTEGFHYEAPKRKKAKLKKNKPKASSSRGGADFEKENHERNKEILEARSEMTPGSGSGSIKGDEQISGIVSVMEELKQQTKTTSRGKKSFSIQKDWLDKLEQDAKAARKEFYYLKFSYGSDNKVYVVTGEDIIMSMIKTMVEDRKARRKAEKEIEVAEKRRRMAEARINYLESRVDYLESLLGGPIDEAGYNRNEKPHA